MKRLLWMAIPALFLAIVLAGCIKAPIDPSALPLAEQVEVAPGVEQVVIFQWVNEPNVLQGRVNAWLRQNHGKVEIVRVLQSQGGQYNFLVTITIFYKKLG